MANFVIVGRRHVPRDQIAFVEPFDPGANPKFQTSRDFKSRVVMRNRDSILIEDPPQAFAEANGFRMIEADKVGLNPAIPFQAEEFVAKEGYVPARPFASRLVWPDFDGNQQSKLLLAEPEMIMNAVAAAPPGTGLTGAARQSKRRARGADQSQALQS